MFLLQDVEKGRERGHGILLANRENLFLSI
jgi:hypothetical protein